MQAALQCRLFVYFWRVTSYLPFSPHQLTVVQQLPWTSKSITNNGLELVMPLQLQALTGFRVYSRSVYRAMFRNSQFEIKYTVAGRVQICSQSVPLLMKYNR